MYHCLPGPGSLSEQDLDTLIVHIRMSNLATRLNRPGGASGGGRQTVDPNAVKMAQKLGIDTSQRTDPGAESGLGGASRARRRG